MDEKELLIEINSLRNKLQQEPQGKRVGTVYIEPCGYSYLENAKRLAKKIIFLRDEYQVEYASFVMDAHINSWLGHEVNYVRMSSGTEQVKYMRHSNEKMERLFYSIFQKIDNELEENIVEV